MAVVAAIPAAAIRVVIPAAAVAAAVEAGVEIKSRLRADAGSFLRL